MTTEEWMYDVSVQCARCHGWIKVGDGGYDYYRDSMGVSRPYCDKCVFGDES